MSTPYRNNLDYIETKPLSDFTEKAYLDYSMTVILDRALPHLSDGLKPVQRRIIYAMSELGLKSTAKFKKSARTVGDVLGKFHPHGDNACYEAMVLMAQAFSYRYPIIDGQGNWGSPDDPKSFAAMRYTESRLTPYAEILLAEIEQGTIDWNSNFDGTLLEPKNLPAQVPNILLNGSTGIAVGMATDIPPHNLQEVVNACIYLLDNPNASIEELTEYLLAPDYPTNAEIITPIAEIKAMYANGYGSIKQRATYEVERDEIIITALPYQVSGNKILEQIAQQMQNKKLPMVTDLRDESCHENPTRLVISPRSSKIDIEALMSHLFASTDLEKNYRINFNMIGLDKKPKVKNLKEILSEWLIFRRNTVKKRLNFRLEKVTQRMHLLAGYLIAFLNLDEVIRIIREEENPKEELIRTFGLSEKQAEAILDLKLRNLAKLEEDKIKIEQNSLEKEKQYLESLLASEKKLTNLIKKECKEIANKYGDNRNSPIITRAEAKPMAKIEQVASEPLTIILSQKGWIRAAKGYEADGQNMAYKAGDGFLMQTFGKSNMPAVFFDTTGRSYAIMASQLPSARGQGEPLTTKLSPPAGAFFNFVLTGDNLQEYLLLSNFGYGFKIKIENLISKNRNGKKIITIPEHAKMLSPLAINNIETDLIVLLSAKGKLQVIEIKEVPSLEKGKGTRLMALDSKALEKGEDAIISVKIISPNEEIKIKAGKKILIISPKNRQQYTGDRGNKGKALPKEFLKKPILA